jgi:hypothetical protein
VQLFQALIKQRYLDILKLLIIKRVEEECIQRDQEFERRLDEKE